MLTTIRSNELRIDRAAKKYVKGIVRAIHRIAFFEDVIPDPILVFGPPGIGKSTVLSTYRSYFDGDDYAKLLMLSDFEEVRPARRSKILSRWSRDGGIIGAADLDPMGDYPGNPFPRTSHIVLLALAEKHYYERRYLRDQRVPGKAEQSAHLVRTWKTIWRDRYEHDMGRDGVIMYNDRVEDTTLWLCLLAFSRTPLDWSESISIRNLVNNINSFPTEVTVYKVIDLPCGFCEYSCIFEITPHACRLVSFGNPFAIRREYVDLMASLSK